MKRNWIFAVVFLSLLIVTVPAYAGVLEAVKGWFGWQAAAYILTGIVAIGAIGKYTDVGSVVCLNIGTFFTNVGLALADRKVTKEELLRAKADFTAIIATVKAAKKNG